ncbi:hypothetical protein CVT26_004364 [Gymnopilus dilepis]|uniref:Uncharacterized protein n=1 Tax=Gymnopilus dilepis TaxID=231916 RepID=A0A409W6R8_9AGAR|nr:hypothetical protein CVT26_004364 [Gymnopilus dilepis]
MDGSAAEAATASQASAEQVVAGQDNLSGRKETTVSQIAGESEASTKVATSTNISTTTMTTVTATATVTETTNSNASTTYRKYKPRWRMASLSVVQFEYDDT